MFGICTPTPRYVGSGQPAVLAPAMTGVLELVTGWFQSPTPAYVGTAERAAPASLLCSFWSAPEPAYVTASRLDDEDLDAGADRRRGL